MRSLLGLCVMSMFLAPGCGSSGSGSTTGDASDGGDTGPGGTNDGSGGTNDGSDGGDGGGSDYPRKTVLSLAWGRPGGGFDIGDPIDVAEGESLGHLWLGVGNFDGKPGMDLVAGEGDPRVVLISGDGARGFTVGEPHEFEPSDSATLPTRNLRLLGAGEDFLFGTEDDTLNQVILLDLTDDKATIVSLGQASMSVLAGVVVQVDDDDLPDLVLGGCDSSGQGTEYPLHVQVYFGSADGLEEGSDNVYDSCGESFEVGMAAEDMDQDGHVDLVMAAPIARDPADPDEVGTVRVLLGDGTGELVEVEAMDLNALDARLAVGDVTGDGLPDVIATGSGLRVLEGTGDGTLTLGASQGQARLESSRTWDADADGDLDLLVRGDGYSLAIWKNDGTGSFTENEDVGISCAWDNCEVADLDQDGILDIASVEVVGE